MASRWRNKRRDREFHRRRLSRRLGPTLETRGWVRYEELEPRRLLAVLSNAGDAADQIYHLPAGANVVEVRQVDVDTFTIDNLNNDATFDDTTFDFSGASVTIHLGDGADTLTLKNLRGTNLDNKLTVAGGAGSDTFHLENNWGLGVKLVEAGDAGSVDTLNFNAFSGAISISPQIGGDVLISSISGADNSSITLTSSSAQNFEDLVGANIDLTGSLKTALIGGMNDLVRFARRVGEFGSLASSLPLVGSNADAAVGKVIDAAESVDKLRLRVEEFLENAPSVTTNSLRAEIDSFMQTASHLGAALHSPEANFLVQAGEDYNFDLALNAGQAASILVDVDTDLGGVLTTAKLVEALNAKIGASSLVGRLAAVATGDGRIAFQVLDLEVNQLSVAALAGAARTKLGFPESPAVLTEVKKILRSLGDLNVSADAASGAVVKFVNGLPELRLDVEYSASRMSELAYDFGDEATKLGLGFDAQARLNVAAALDFDFALGLSLTSGGAGFFVDVDTLRAAAKVDATVSGVALNVGFLNAQVGGKVSLEAGVAVNLLGDGVITSSDLASADVDTLISGLTLTDFAGTAASTPSFLVDLDVGVNAGLSSLGGFSAAATLDAAGNPFDGDSPTISVDASFDPFLNFNNLNSAGVISLLGQVSTWLDKVRGGELIGSLKLPLVNGTLDKVLALAEVFSDALLFDEGPDDVKDGANKLVTDLNAALVSAGVGELIRAQGNGKQINLLAANPNVTAFSIANIGGSTGFGQMGLTNGAASLMSGVLTKSGAAIAASLLKGVLTGDAEFAVTTTLNGDIATTKVRNVKLLKTVTENNLGVGDDAPKLLNAANAATFSSAQELAARLAQIVTLGAVQYTPSTNELTYAVSFTDVPLFSVELPTDFALDLSPIANIQSNTRLVVDATGGLNFVLGFNLGDTVPGASAITDATTLAALGIASKLEEAITADAAPRSIVGNLSGDAAFEVSLGNDTVNSIVSTNGTASVLHDVTQNFLADSKVKIGDTVFNLTDGSQAKVLSVTNMMLTTAPLTGGSDNTWQLNDQYRTAHLVTVAARSGRAGTDRNVTKHPDPQHEATIAVNPLNPLNIIVGVNDGNALTGNFGSVSANDSVWVTIDGGMNWMQRTIPLPAGGLAGHGDPSIVFDRFGRAVYAHLVDTNLGANGVHNGSDDGHIIATAVSTDGGLSWNPLFATAVTTVGPILSRDDDKEFLAVGPDVDNPTLDRFALVWHRRGVLYASTSLDGATWTQPVQVSNATGGDSTNIPPTGDAIDSIPAFGPNGEIYVVWEDHGTPGVSKIMFDVSFDGGLTWGGGQDRKVFFNTAESTLTNDDRATLDQFAAVLTADPQLVVTISGFTDRVGADADNQTLADARAQSVFTYLTVTKGIAASRLRRLGFGEQLNAVPTADGVENAQNRRVELTVDRLVHTGNVNAFDDRGLISGATPANPVVISSNTPHGLSTGARVQIEGVVGMTELNGRQFNVTVAGPTSFSLDGENGAAHTAYDSGGTWTQVGAISGATQANPVVITTAQPHFLTTGQRIEIANVVGMTQLNGRTFTITVTGANTFSLDGLNGMGFGAYTSGGTWKTIDLYVVPAQPRRGIWMGLSMDVDRSKSEHKGRIYVAFADQADLDEDNDRGNPPDHNDTDIFVIASDNFGATWAALGANLADDLGLAPKRVNDDATINSQFFSWLDVDQATGNVAVSWYDARNDNGVMGSGFRDAIANTEVQYFASFSSDGGQSWAANILVSDGVSNASLGGANDYGDYTGLVFLNDTIHMTWADNSNSTNDNPDSPSAGGAFFTDAYYDRIRLSNQTMMDLLDDINAGIAALPALAGKIEAQADGNRLKLVAVSPAVTGFSVAATSANPAFRDLGIQASAAAAKDANGNLVLKAAKDVPTLVGQLTADAAFDLTLNGVTKTIAVKRADTAANRNILDLVNDVQKAVDRPDAGFGPNQIGVSSSGGRLIFTRLGAATPGASDSFMINPGANSAELGLGAAQTSDEADLLITLSNGATTHRVKLDGAMSVGEVIAAIESQTSFSVDAFVTVDDPNGKPTPVNEAGSGLTLKDLSSGAAGGFMVNVVNGSLAGLKLGIVGVDKNPLDPDDEADKTIVGGSIGGVKLTDRFFLTAPDLSSIADAKVNVTAGVLVKNIEAKSATVIKAGNFFTAAHKDLTLVLKNVAGFKPGTYAITAVNADHEATLSASAEVSAGQKGGVGILKTGVDASANFGFVGIGLEGDAGLNAKLSLGFNTNAPELADNRLTLTELINGLDHITSLLTPPSLTPASGMNFGGANLGLFVTVGGVKVDPSDMSEYGKLAKTLLGGATPSVGVTIVTPGDPFIDIRLSQAGYNRLSAEQFEVNGNLTGLLPISAKLRFDDEDFTITAAMFAGGKTTVTVTPVDAGTLPSSLAGVDAAVLPTIDFDTSALDGLDLANFANLKFDNIFAALQALSGFLGQFEAFGFLNEPLPLVDKSVNDLLAFAEDFADALSGAPDNAPETLEFLETKLKQAIGISDAKIAEVMAAAGLPTDANTDVIDISLVDGDVLRIDLFVGTSFSRGLSLNIPGIDFGDVFESLGLGNLLDLSASAGLNASGAVAFTLALGIDLGDLGAGPLLFKETADGNPTGLTAAVNVAGTDIAFRAGLGPFSLSVATLQEPGQTIQSRIDIAAEAGLGIAGSFSGLMDRVPLTDVVIDVSLSGTIAGTLPVFFPNDNNHIGEIRIGDGANINNPASLANIDNLFLKSNAADTPPANSLVIDVSPVVAGVSSFNFDNFDLFSNIFLAVDGLDLVLGSLQDVLDVQLGEATIPLIGGELSKGARFIQDLREDLIAPLRDGLEKTKDIALNFADPDKNIISEKLYKILGPANVGGVGLLKQQSGNGDSPGDFIGLSTNLDDFLFNPNTTLQLKDVFVEWDVKLGTVLVNSNTDIGFDLGIPGLGLKTEGAVTLDVAWQLDLGFGLSGQDGFYLDISSPHELLFDVSVGLPGAGVKGTLGFLELRAHDMTLNVLGEDRSTALGAMFFVDISNGSNTFDQKLGFRELGDMSFAAGVAAEASAILGFELGLSTELLTEIFGSGAAGVVAGFPKLRSDFAFVWELGARNAAPGASLDQIFDASSFRTFTDGPNQITGNSIAAGLKLVQFQNTRLDIGTFLQDVLGPIAEAISTFTDPIQPLIDFVTSPVPLLGDLGLNVTWLDLAQTLGGANVGMIKAIAEIIDVIDIINSVAGSGDVPLPVGTITVFQSAGATDDFVPDLWKSDLDLDQVFSDIQGAGGLITDLIGQAGGIANTLQGLANDVGFSFNQKEAAKALAGVVGASSAGGFSFPLFENPVEQAFGLLFGKEADLVRYDLAPLMFNFEVSAFFPILGPLGISIGLIADLNIDTAFVYDTFGIRRFVETGFKNPLLLFEGFAISDSPDFSGEDLPEVTFNAELFATAELNLAIARAGVQASLSFEILFDLFDPNNDGKVRITEIINNIANQLKAPGSEKLLAPLAIFDVSGTIFAELFAFLKIDFGLFTFEKEFPIVDPVTLADFEIDFFRPPTLANELENGDLLINVGKFAEQRLLGIAKDVGERLEIKSNGVDGDFVKVLIKAKDGALGDDADVPQEYRVRKGGKIIIDSGAGDDEFDLSMFSESLVLFDIDAGAGNDVIKLSNAAKGVAGKSSTLRGGAGNDTITGSGGSDLIIGDAGNDTITANDGDDLVFGDGGEVVPGAVRGLTRPTDGRDTILGGGGADILIGSGEADTIEGGDGDDLILGDGGLIMFVNPNLPPTRGNVKALHAGGVSETDKPLAAFNDVLKGDGGNDVVFAGTGNDTIFGGAENDILFGESGFDTIHGDGGADTIFGDSGTFVLVGANVMIVPGDAGNDDTIFGGAGNDKIFGNGGNDVISGGVGDDEIRGGSGADVIHGDDGSDNILGEGGPDTLFGDEGNDTLDGGAGPDMLFGGDGSDVLRANKSGDVLNGNNGSDFYFIDFQGGAASSLITVFDDGGAGTDVMILTGTVFDDRFLLRSNTDGSVAFVAMLNALGNVERVGYNDTIERIVLNGSFGDDEFQVDDTAAELTINGEDGEDRFQIGQLYRSPRTETEANVSVDDEFATISTTRGFLSNGISKPLTINGGADNDNFVVFHNKAILSLNGEDGDDRFEIRAFALTGSQEPQRERTDISGGVGADLVMYVVNAPVNIDGGDGFDRVVIIGTEFGDDFVITDRGVFGAGLNVNFVNIEALQVDGAEGNDRFFVQSTSEKFVTEIFGGLGDDTFNMSGDMPPVVSNDLLGHSGVVMHGVESADPNFDGQKLYGISANVADNDEPAIAIRTTDGATIISEGDPLGDSYTIVLTRQPTATILVRALAPLPSPTDRELRRRPFRVDSPTRLETVAEYEGSFVTLRFTPADWYLPQTVRVLADAATTFTDKTTPLFTRPELGDSSTYSYDDPAFEGVRYGVVTHIVSTEFNPIKRKPSAVSGVSFTDAGAGFTAELVGRRVEIASGKGTGEVRFIRAVSGDTLTLDRPWRFGYTPTTESEYIIRLDDAFVGAVSSFINDEDNKTFTFTDDMGGFPTVGEGLRGAIIEIVSGPGAGQQRMILSNTATTLTLNGAWRTEPEIGKSIYRISRYTNLAVPGVLVEIHDNDAAGVIVTQSESRTAVIEGSNGDQPGEQDELQIQLTRAPTAPVTVNFTLDAGQLVLGAASLNFNDGDWNVPQPLSISAFNDLTREGFHTSLLQFGVTSTESTPDVSPTEVFTIGLAQEPVFFVGLSQKPKAGTTPVVVIDTEFADPVTLTSSQFVVRGNKIVFLDGSPAGDLLAVQGKISVTYTYAVPSYNGSATFTDPVLVRIADDDAPTVLIRESNGSTDVIEIRAGGAGPDSIPVANTGQPHQLDFYEVVLTAQPSPRADGQVSTVTITLVPQITKTTRTGGIRHDEVQVSISSLDPRAAANPDGTLTVTFTTANWDLPLRVDVAAIDDNFVDGADTQVFAPGPNTLSGIQGPITVDGAGGNGSLTGIAAPFLLPIGADGINPETNVKESTGEVQTLAGTALTVLTDDLEDVLAKLGLTIVSELVNKTVEVTLGPAVGQFRLITEVVVSGAHTTLTLNEPFDLEPGDLESEIDEYAITAESLNFFVKEEEAIDYMFVFDSDSPADSAGVLTGSRLSGLNMGPDLVIGGQLRPGGITYGALEVLEINLGRGFNHFQVLGAPKRADGFQTWTILNTGDDIPDPNQPLLAGDTVIVRLNAVEEVTGAGTIAAAANGLSPSATLSSAFANGSLAGQLLEITDGTGAGQTRRILGNTGHLVTLAAPWETLPVGGAYRIINEADGNLAVNLQGGDDALDASGSTLGIVVFGGLGDDQITGGDGNDILFGDRGDVAYFNEAGEIVTRLGRIRDPILRFADAGSTATTLFDADADFETENDGLKGLLVTIINGTGAPSFDMPAQRRFITGNSPTTLLINEPWDVIPDATSQYRISTVPEDQTDGVVRDPSRIVTVGTAGGNDVIHGGEGNDQILGGAGDDVISAGAGEDLVLGDAGRIDLTPESVDPENLHFGVVVVARLERVRTIQFAVSGVDVISGNAGADLLIGGSGVDTIHGDDAIDSSGAADLADILVGDNGEAVYAAGLLTRVFTTDAEGAHGAGDVITGGAGGDLILGGAGGDHIRGGMDDDIALGDFGEFTFQAATGVVTHVTVTDLSLGGPDTIYGGDHNDILIGGADGDLVDGDAGDDVIFGDAVTLIRDAGNVVDPRFQTLSGQLLYARPGGGVLVDAAPRPYRTQSGGTPPSWLEFRIVTLHHSAAIASDPALAGSFGNDYLAGGPDNDTIFGQLGDDTIQGDGGIESADSAAPVFVSAVVPAAGPLVVTPSFEAATDGDDYIEGNGGNDVIFGNLGQDDLIGGSSSMFTLTAPEMRPDGADIIIGGAGTRLARNAVVDGADAFFNERHARDADAIIGDNGNIVRVVGVAGVDGGAFLRFNYDDPAIAGYSAARPIIPRSVELLDYTAGPNGASPADLGAADVLHGESGDDQIWAMTGNDVVFGDSEDDDLIGGDGADRISGGAGEDGIAGDNGLIATSRNGRAEPLHALQIANAEEVLSVPGPFVGAVEFISGRLTKSFTALAWADGSADVLYGGLGDDFMHGGAGDDAMSGAEALPEFYVATPHVLENPLGYDPATRKFAAYDANNPRTKIAGFLLNFEAVDAGGVKIEDGKDRMFGDLGHDWLVGGTGKDRLFGGAGDDLHNADDNHDTNGGLNNQPDSPAFADGDFAYGGEGLDVLIGNTGNDRLADWKGEFNSFIVPFSPFGISTVVRLPSPHWQAFVDALGRTSGADLSLTNPDSEVGLTTADAGGPRDPQAGNNGGVARDTQGAPEDDRGRTPTAAGSTPGAPATGSSSVPAATTAFASTYAPGTAIIAANEAQPATNALYVFGTSAADNIEVRAGSQSNMLQVMLNGESLGQFTKSISAIYIYGEAGDDAITVNANAGAIRTIIYGGMGDDVLTAGSGESFLDGEDGDDTLQGGFGRDVLIGGFGSDVLRGWQGEDVLFGGVYNDAGDPRAVDAVLAEWSRTDLAYQSRVQNLLNGGGLMSGYRLNLSRLTDDSLADYLYGEQHLDLFFLFDDDESDGKIIETIVE